MVRRRIPSLGYEWVKGIRSAAKGIIMERRIFVSCGQENEGEITLGREIKKTIDHYAGMMGFLHRMFIVHLTSTGPSLKN